MKNSQSLPPAPHAEIPPEETLVADIRGQVPPSEMVTNRLRQVLGHLPLFHASVSDLLFGRRPLAQESAANRTESESTQEDDV